MTIETGSLSPESARRSVLHVGCGAPNPETLHRAFRGAEWREVRLDIDPSTRPDIIASLTDMAEIESGTYDSLIRATISNIC